MIRSVTLFLFTMICIRVPAQLKLTYPLQGIPGKHFFIDYYVDHDTRKGQVRDALCGGKTYDGHEGTDFLIKNFKTMDSGVTVYAVADGKVYETQDGNYDRNKHWQKGIKSNFVGVGCAGGYYVTYHHLKRNSIVLKPGDSVHTGDPVGMVGSSGYSCYPHLHLEIRDKLNFIVDPFTGSCDTGAMVKWIKEPGYDTALYSIDNGFVPYVPGYDTLLDGFLVKDTFDARHDTVICFWDQVHGLKKNDELHYEWITPRNKVWDFFNYNWSRNWWYDYSWTWIKMPRQKGRWQIKHYVNNKMIAQKAFYVR